MHVTDQIDFAQRGPFKRLVGLAGQGELNREDAGWSAAWRREQALKDRYAAR